MLRLFAFAAVIALTTKTARAQDLEAYAGLEVNHVSNLQKTYAYSNGANQYTYQNITPVGFDAGITWYRLHTDNASLGSDLRFTVASGAEDFFFGEKVSIHPGASRFRPYAELGVYIGDFRAPTSTFNSLTQSYTPNSDTTQVIVTFKLAGGLDYDIGHNLSYRVVEVGGGPHVSANGATSITVSTGLVARF